MQALTIHQARQPLRREIYIWQRAAIGLLVLSVLFNTALCARIDRLENARRETTAQLEAAERTRDLAVQELGAMSIRAAEEQQARAAQAAAYEALSGYQYVGECTITAYCCEPYAHVCGTGDGLTATGLPVAPGMVAVDPEVIPLGSTVVIDGQQYLAADTGGAVKGLTVDIAVATHQEAIDFGLQNAPVWIVKEVQP